MRKMLPVLSLALLLATTAARAAEQRSGAVESADATQVKVAGKTYAIERETQLVDCDGQRIAPNELKPGTPVDLDIDDDGRLATLRATLVR
ncbi:MAG: hypothetical protein HY271_20785 [Deltaproteobacteria bacterium]|nr:hypothetical protein [Deltaproteobacteria bacterium]